MKPVSHAIAEKVSAALDAPVRQLFKPSEAGKELADATIKYYYTLINSILNKAVKWGVILDNPCRRVDLPKVRRREIQFFEEEDVARLLECLQKESAQHQIMILLFLNLGMRRGDEYVKHKLKFFQSFLTVHKA